MALMTCPECKHSVSSTAPTCPSCGHPIAGSQGVQAEAVKAAGRMGAIWVGAPWAAQIIVGGLMVAGFLGVMIILATQ
ncbi:zinc ribbon domain-containing protein [Chitinimonas lacunae]|uniref:Zinc ribbon domain-containing protein n=1 Tax=Chitinimonas lacunae TaxID=1963018 RepID=A0ABV8MY37_9NEIS